MKNLTILFLTFFAFGLIWGQDAKSIKSVKKAIPFKKVTNIQPVPQLDDHYLFRTETGQGVWNHQLKKAILQDKKALSFMPSEVKEVWVWVSSKFYGLYVPSKNELISIKLGWLPEKVVKLNTALVARLIQQKGLHLDNSGFEFDVGLIATPTSFSITYSDTGHNDLDHYALYRRGEAQPAIGNNGELLKIDGGWFVKEKEGVSLFTDQLKEVCSSFSSHQITAAHIHQLLPTHVDTVYKMDHNAFIFENSGKKGLYHFNDYWPRGITLGAEYDIIEPLNWLYGFISKEGKSGVYIDYGDDIIPCEYNNVQFYTRNNCSQYVRLDYQLFSIQTLDCEGHDRLIETGLVGETWVSGIIPSSLMQLSSEDILLSHSYLSKKDLYDEYGERYYSDRYVARSGVYNRTSNTWVKQNECCYIQKVGNRYIVGKASPAEHIHEHETIYFQIADENLNPRSNVRFTQYYPNKSGGVLVDEFGNFWGLSEGKKQLIEMGNFNAFAAEFRGGFFVISQENLESGLYDVPMFDERGQPLYNELGEELKVTEYWFDENFNPILFKGGAIRKALPNDFAIAECKVEYFDEDMEQHFLQDWYFLYDVINASKVDSTEEYQTQGEDSIQFGNTWYVLSSMREPGMWGMNAVRNKALSGLREMGGVVTVHYFTDKRGTEHPDQPEYFLLIENKEYWVKLNESVISEGHLKALLGKNLSFEGVLLEGEWDGDGSGKMQSRIGPYVVIQKVIK